MTSGLPQTAGLHDAPPSGFIPDSLPEADRRSADTGIGDDQWEFLLDELEDGNCTPFLGAGACYPRLPLARDLALAWAEEHSYPFPDAANLASVAQFVTTKFRNARPIKRDMQRVIAEAKQPDFVDRPEGVDIHSLLAEFPLRFFLTTNYDDTMFQALQFHRKKPRRSCCKWNSWLLDPRNYKSCFDEDALYEASAEEPTVYHLHGIAELWKSMVLLEDDYVDFLAACSGANDRVIDRALHGALSTGTLVFIGYSLEDWNFRAIFSMITQKLTLNTRERGITVQLDPSSVAPGREELAREYMLRRMDALNLDVYWGTAAQFAGELRDRWRERQR